MINNEIRGFFKNSVGKKIVNKVYKDGIVRGFGTGTIIKADNDKLEVRFDNNSVIILSQEYFSKANRFVDPSDNDMYKNLTDNYNIQQNAIKVASLHTQPSTTKIDKLNNKQNTTKVSKLNKQREINLNLFGNSYNTKSLVTNNSLRYDEVEKQHNIKIKGAGGGIKINDAKKEIILLSYINQDNSTSNYEYHDKWNDLGEYEYSGKGKIGNQKLTGLNLKLYEANKNGYKIHLYICFKPKDYFYQGEMKLIDRKTGYRTTTSGDELIFVLKRV